MERKDKRGREARVNSDIPTVTDVLRREKMTERVVVSRQQETLKRRIGGCGGDSHRS